MAGCPRTLFLDQADTASAAERVRTAIEREGGGASPLAPAFMERIVRVLSGTFDSGAGKPEDPKEAEDTQDQLTERQAVLLRATRAIPRIQFIGGAGSGKTWLALEKTRLLCKQGKRVGLFSYNKGLSQYLQDRVASWRHAGPAFTGEFHEYVRRLGVPDGAGPAYFEEEMPRLLQEHAGRMDAHERLDAVVVDEAQDFAPLWWEALLACTKDPDGGEVYAFMDDHQDVYRRWGGASPDRAHPAAGLVPIHIDENLRNTRKIADTFKSFAGEHFTPRGSTGLPVRRVECATDDALGFADDSVEALMDEGWASNQIALLTTKSRHPVHKEHVDNGSLAEYWLDFHANNGAFYGHVLGFKGLERSVVVLCVNGFKELDRAGEQLYVGLSRARSLLVVVGDSRLLEEAGGAGLKLALSRADPWRPGVRAE
jgi:ATP:corrinoid adenosyltransferase